MVSGALVHCSDDPASPGGGTADAEADVASSSDSSTTDGDFADTNAADATPADANAEACAPTTIFSCEFHYRAERQACTPDAPDASIPRTACPKGCTGGACNTTCDPATTIVDQSTTNDHLVVVGQWQSFTSTTTGVLEKIDIRPNAFGGIAGNLIVYLGEGVSGPVLQTQAYSIASVSGGPYQEFTLTAGVPVQTGQKYTWQLTGATDFYLSTNNPYAGGISGAGASTDLVFRAHVAACR